MARSRVPRVLRGTAAASVATFGALLSHLAGGGAVPGWLGIAAPWVLAVMVCTILAGRALSLVRLSAAVALSQALFHALFVLGLSDAGTGQSAGHQHDLGSSAVGAATMTGMTHADGTMWGWHVIAAVATIAVLYRGERLIRGLLGLAGEIVSAVRRRLAAGAVVVGVGARSLPGPAAPARVLAPLGWYLDAIARRGPPLHSVV